MLGRDILAELGFRCPSNFVVWTKSFERFPAPEQLAQGFVVSETVNLEKEHVRAAQNSMEKSTVVQLSTITGI